MDNNEDTNLESQEYYGAIVSIQWSNNGWTEAGDISKSNYDWVRQHGETFDCWNFSHEVHNIDGWHVGYTSSFNTHLPTEEKRESIKYLFFRSLDINTNENKIIGYYKDPQFGAFTASDGFEGNIRARIDDMVLFKNPILVKDIASVGYKSNGEPKEISKQGYTYINKEVVDTLLQTQQQSYMEDIQKFKNILEAFVAHLSYLDCGKKGQRTPGYEKYIKPIPELKETSIQHQISDWCKIGDYRLHAKLSGFARNKYRSRSNYLNWENTGLNVTAEWDDSQITYLYLNIHDSATKDWSEPLLRFTPEELGLFDGNEIPKQKLQDFFNEYYKLMQNYQKQTDTIAFNDMENIQKFKHVLEYFVTHANYRKPNKDTDNIPGYDQYLKHYIDNGTFKLSGNGKIGQKIQEQISDWDQIGPYHICIYMLDKDYLIWENSDTYISIQEKDDNNTMSLYIDVLDAPTKKKRPRILEYPIEKLGLYDGLNVPTKELQRFFNKFYEMAQGIESEHIETYKMEGLAKYINTLRENYNIILNGAPGTGKTFMAKEIAAEMVAGKSYAELNDDERNRIGFVQFHPSFDYTDFVEGLRPIKDESGNVVFKRIDGTFKAFCNNAQSHPESRFVFIIDEINRGELSKIFGELFFSIDPGYREKENRVKVKTQYQNLVEEGDPFYEGFYVPENVYIIGTMNDIDRSVESMDFAMRRRFTFTEITAKESERILDSVKEWPEDTDKEGLIMKMEALNSAIEKVEGLSSAFHLGGAYFKKIEKCESYMELWDQYLESIVKEYLRGMPKAEELLKTLKAAYNGTKEEEE